MLGISLIQNQEWFFDAEEICIENETLESQSVISNLANDIITTEFVCSMVISCYDLHKNLSNNMILPLPDELQNLFAANRLREIVNQIKEMIDNKSVWVDHQWYGSCWENINQCRIEFGTDDNITRLPCDILYESAEAYSQTIEKSPSKEEIELFYAQLLEHMKNWGTVRYLKNRVIDVVWRDYVNECVDEMIAITES